MNPTLEKWKTEHHDQYFKLFQLYDLLLVTHPSEPMNELVTKEILKTEINMFGDTRIAIIKKTRQDPLTGMKL